MSGKGQVMAEYRGVHVGVVTLKKWRALEEEYGEPIRDIIMGFRSDGLTWRTIAGILEVCEKTLISWRDRLGIPLEPTNRLIDEALRPTAPSDRAAQALGYRDMADALRDMRVRQRLTMAECAARLGVCLATVNERTPDELRGLWFLSEEGRRERREHGKWLSAHNQMRQAGKHPWQRDDEQRFGYQEAAL